MTRNRESLLEVRNMTKRFPGCVALDSVDFEVQGGEIHVLFGENGAGKTTMTKILTGILHPDDGEIYIKGNQVKLKSPYHTRSLGISAVHQDFDLVPQLSVMANIFLGQEVHKGMFLNETEMLDKARSCLSKIRFVSRINLRQQVRYLSMNQQQAIKIAKSLIQDASILILDEPLANLGEDERLAVYEILNRLRAEGKGIVYATDVIDETERVADRVTILQHGQKVALLANKEEITAKNLLRGILGVIFKWKAVSGWPVEYVSSNVESQFGYRPDDFVTNKTLLRDIIHPDDLTRVEREMELLEKPGLDYLELEYRIIGLDGQHRWVHQSTIVNRDHNGVVTHYHGDVLDITESKRAEEALQQSEEKYESLIKNIPDTIYSALPVESSPMIFISDRYRDWTGFRPEDFYGDTGAWPKSVHPADIDRAAKKYLNAVKQKREYISEYRVVHKDTGEVRYLRDHGIPVKDRQGNVIMYDGIITDVTERKEAESELQESEEFLSNLLSNAPNPIVVINPDTSIKYVNPALEALTGFSSSEVIDHIAPYPWCTAETLETIYSGLRKPKGKHISHREELFRRRDGGQFWVEISSVAVKSEGKAKYYLESWNDVTTEKQLRENLRYYTNAVTRAQEEERGRISRELHDDTLQAMFSICTDIEAMIGDGNVLSREGTRQLEQMEIKIGETMNNVRRFCNELRPGIMDRFGLIASLEMLTKEMNQEGKSKCYFEATGDKRRLSSDIELVLFRITQEALYNIKRHANATEVTIMIKFTDGEAQLNITDNGDGFQVPGIIGDLARDGKLGLVGMQERTQLIGGTLSVDSEINKGTAVKICVRV